MTSTPKPAVTVKLREKPDRVDTGSDARFEVETNASDGRCSLAVAYRDKDELQVAAGEIDDGRCSWKVKIPTEIPKKGTATLTVVVRKNTRKDSTEYRILTKEFDVKR